MNNKPIPPEARRYIALAEQAYQDFDYQDSIKYRKLANQMIQEQNDSLEELTSQQIDFNEWLKQCPVQWEYKYDGVYQFFFDDEDDESPEV